MNKLKKALEKLLDAAHPAYVSDNHFQKKLIAARDNAFQELESHRLDMKDHIADAGQMVSLRDYFAVQVIGQIYYSQFTQLTFEAIAVDAFRLADAMLKEREKCPQS